MKKITLDNESPYYSQLKDFLIEEIENGNLRHGDKLPSERELAETYKVSRMTARHALGILEREGFVERIIGGGTFVIGKKIKLDGDNNFLSLSKKIMESGSTPETTILFMGIKSAKNCMVRSLGIEEDEQLMVIKRLRIADDIPIAIEWSYIPYSYCPGIKKYIKKDISLYKVLEDVYSIKLVRVEQYTRIALSDEHESKLLKIKNDSPCIFIESITYDTLGRKIEFAQTKARGDIVRYYDRKSIE